MNLISLLCINQRWKCKWIWIVLCMIWFTTCPWMKFTKHIVIDNMNWNELYEKEFDGRWIVFVDKIHKFAKLTN
jgi:hypothetical protein